MLNECRLFQIVRLSTIPIIILLWQLSSWLELFDQRLFPSPLEVMNTLLDMIQSGELVRDLQASFLRAIGGIVIGISLGIGLGVGTGKFQILSGSVGQVLSIFRPVPAIAIIPFVIIWLGVGEVAKITIVSWAVLFPVWIATHIGISQVDEKIIWAAKSLGANNWKTLFYFLVPSALPLIHTGIRTGIGLAFISLYAAEMAGSVEGIGYRIFTSHLVFRIDKMIVALAALGMLGASIDYAYTYLSKKMFPWMFARIQTQ